MLAAHIFYFSVVVVGFSTCKNIHKRELNRGTNVNVIGPAVESERVHLYRYLVSVQYNCNHICGGTIVSMQLILTAAHCVVERNPRKVTIKTDVINPRIEDGDIRDVFSIKIHSGYRRQTLWNDIAVLTLQEPLDAKKYIAAKIPKEDENFEGSVVEVSGWGKTVNLTYGYFTVKKNNACKSLSHICVTPFSGMATYYGDSGSPAVIRQGSDVTLVGMVSGKSKGPRHHLFVNVAHLRPWIFNALVEGIKFFNIGKRFLPYLPKHRCRFDWEKLYKILKNKKLKQKQ